MLEKTTVSATRLSWVDNVPGAVSTGYQAQNVAAESVRVGYDSIVIEAGESGGLRVKQGGTIDENGILYTVKSDHAIVTISGSDFYYFALKEESNGNKSVEMISQARFNDGVFVPARNAFYTSDGRRILDSFVVSNFFSQQEQIHFYSVFKLEKGSRSLSKLPLSNNKFEIIDHDSFGSLKLTCGGAIEYDFAEYLPALNLLKNSGISYESGRNENSRVFIAGSNSMVYMLSPRTLAVKGISLGAHFFDVEITGIAYVGYYTGYDSPLLAVSTSDRKIRFFGNFDAIISGNVVQVKVIDLSGLLDEIWDIDFKNGELYSCSGVYVYRHYLLTSNIIARWEIPTRYFCVRGGNIETNPLNIIWTDQTPGAHTPFHRSRYYYQRLKYQPLGENYNSPLFRFRFSSYNCCNIAEGDGVLMSFDNLTGILHVQ